MHPHLQPAIRFIAIALSTAAAVRLLGLSMALGYVIWAAGWNPRSTFVEWLAWVGGS